MKILLQCLLLLLLPTSVLGASTFSITEQGSYVYDSLHSFTIENVMELDDSKWIPIDEEFSLGLIYDTVWLRFPIPSTEDFDVQDGILTLSNPLLNKVEFFLVANDKVVSRAEHGDHATMDKRGVKVSDIYWQLPHGWQDADQLYVRIRSDSFFQAHFKIKTVPQTILDHGTRYWFLGFFYGALVIMLLYNLFIYFQVKDIGYIYYAAYVLSVSTFHFFMDGFAYYFLSENYEAFGDRITVYFVNLSNIFGLLFVTNFLQIRSGPLYKGIRSLIIMFVIATAIEVVEHGHLSAIVSATFTIVSALTVSYITISSWLRGNEMARYVALAWIVLLLSIPVYALALNGFVPHNVYTLNAVRIGIALELALLSFSLAHRINLLRRERLTLQRRLNQELGTLVKERTQELEAANQKLQQLSETDALTNIRNRAFFNRTIAEETARAIRNDKPLSILLADLDHFKSINDDYGHNAGDYCLRHFAKILEDQLVRKTDTACRYGGEEFVALLPDTDQEGAIQVAERIRKLVESTKFIFEGTELRVTVSIGVYTNAPHSTWTGDDWVKHADKALYFAKTQRNRVAYLDDQDRPAFVESGP